MSVDARKQSISADTLDVDTLTISVVVCIYSSAEYNHFCTTIDSLRQQHYDAVEPVVIVDGDSDLHARIQADFPTLPSYCNTDNYGLLTSRNRGATIANGDVVAFLDADARAEPQWAHELARVFEENSALAAGGPMVANWPNKRPYHLPNEFDWLVGVTHRGFADEAGDQIVRNTFGSNLAFRRDVFDALGGFDTAMGGRKGEGQLQGGETELCARLHREFGTGVTYVPGARVVHQIEEEELVAGRLFRRAFWQGYSKYVMQGLSDEGSTDEESSYLRYLITDALPRRVADLATIPAYTGAVAAGYVYGRLKA